MTGWPHARSGTCVPGCALYGRCHCGCGEESRLHQHPAVRRRLVDIETPRQLARWLIRRYGAYGAADVAGLQWATFRNVAYRADQRSTSPWIAHRLIRAVRAHGPRVVPRDMWRGLAALEQAVLAAGQPYRRPRRRSLGLLPAAPLREFVGKMSERHGLTELARRCAARFGENPAGWERFFLRLRRWRWCRVETVDRVCIALGHHPAEVYGEAWWLREEEEAV